MNALKNATILAVDDDPLNLIILNELLEHRCKQLLLQNDIELALVLACKKQPDIILLDILMDEINGYEVCRRLKSNTETQAIPVIFLSSLMRSSDKVKGFEAGGVDYISKPFEIEEMLARIECCLKLHQQINQKRKMTVQEQAEKIKLFLLSEREVEIFHLYISGCPRNEIAQKLAVSENTIKWHLKNILTKLKVKNRIQAIEKARKIGLIG